MSGENQTFALPATGFLRLSQIVGNPKAVPPIPAIYPVGRSTWWQGVKAGRFPAPVKLGPKTTAWRVEDIRKLLDEPNGNFSPTATVAPA